MMKKYCWLLIFYLLMFSNLYATHGAGGSVTYKHISGNDYLVTISYIRDCNGIAVSIAPRNLQITNTCGFGTQTLALPLVLGPIEITEKCNAQLPTVACTSNIIGGPANTFSLFQWQDTVSLPGQCNEWYFSFSECCRSGAIVNGPANTNMHIESMLNNAQISENSSPVIVFHQTPILCQGQINKISLGVIETEGDSLAFEFVSVKTSQGNNFAAYTGGYSGTSPLGGAVTIDPITGEITATVLPFLATGSYVIAVKISDFENGVFKGYITYETRIAVVTCSGNQNPISPNGVINFTGTATLDAPKIISGKPGETACFDIVFTDNTSQNLDFITNIDSIIPNATITSNTTIAGTLTINVCFTIDNTINSSIIVFKCFDDYCPFYGKTFFSITINVENCEPNTSPLPPSGMLNFSGTAQQTGLNTIQGSIGQTTCFDIIFQDSPLDSVIILSNLSSLFPNSSFTQNQFTGGTIGSTFCFTITDSTVTIDTLFISATDNSCDFIGESNYFIIIETTSNYDSTIIEPSNLVFYSGFTPNNDGINDTWIIDGLTIGNHQVIIINRWGDVVWETNNYDNTNNVWKGENSNGKTLSTGIYFYSALINGINYTGNIELTR
jgi:gliding motility-associated-like protein